MHNQWALRITTLCLGVVSLGLATAVSAQVSQPDIDAIAPRQEQILQQQQQQFDDVQRQQHTITPPTSLPALTADSALDFGECVDINNIDIRGGTLIAETQWEQRFASHIPACFTIAEMNGLLEEITQYYVQKGYATSRAYLSPEGMQEGILVMHIIEGELSNIALHNQSIQTSNRTRHIAFPGAIGKMLNIRHLEQGLDQINRLQRYQATMELLPGAMQGKTDLAITRSETKPWWMHANIDNSGQSSTGEEQASITIGFDDMLGLYESISASYKVDAEGNHEGLSSHSLSGNFSIPYGYWTLRFSASLYRYLTTLEGVSQSFRSSGDSVSYSAAIDHVLHRDDKSKTQLSASLTTQENRNFIEEQYISASSRRLTIGQLSLQHSTRIKNAVINATLSYERGLKLLDALQDSATANDNTPRAQFSKWSTTLGLHMPFTVWGQRFLWDGLVHGQWSSRPLFSTQQLSLGGLTTVRGFRDNSISGDVGGYMRNELRWVIPENSQYIEQAHLYAGVDMGWIKENSPTEKGHMRGVALGVRANTKRFDINLGWEKALTSPSFLQDDEEEIYYVKMGVRF